MPDISRLFEDRISRWKDVLPDSCDFSRRCGETRRPYRIPIKKKITSAMYRQVYYIWDSRRKAWKKEVDGSEIQVSECHTMARKRPMSILIDLNRPEHERIATNSRFDK